MQGLPDFLGIGAMRAGTSWLHAQTKAHPQIWTPRRKELHFFDRELPPAALHRRSAEWLARWRYRCIFLPGTLQGKRCGETTPAYAILDSARIGLIRRWMPQLRLVYVVRDPVERAWSHARKDFLQFHGRRLDQVPREELLDFFRSEGVLRRGDYVGCLQRWLEHFPRERILVLFYEDICARPRELLRQLYGFLGVDPAYTPPEELVARRVNARPAQPMPAEIRRFLEDQLYPLNAPLAQLLGRSLPWGPSP